MPIETNRMEHTVPPCISCHAHDSLELKVDKAIKKGEAAMRKDSMDHKHIMDNIDGVMSDIKWMNIIGKWILVSLFSYFIALGYYILSNDCAEERELHALEETVKDGEILHYQNERIIEGISVKLSTIMESIKLAHKEKE